MRFKLTLGFAGPSGLPLDFVLGLDLLPSRISLFLDPALRLTSWLPDLVWPQVLLPHPDPCWCLNSLSGPRPGCPHPGVSSAFFGELGDMGWVPGLPLILCKSLHCLVPATVFLLIWSAASWKLGSTSLYASTSLYKRRCSSKRGSANALRCN